MKAFLKSALCEQRCLSCSVELKVVLIKLLQLTDFAQTNQASEVCEPFISARIEMFSSERQSRLMIIHDLRLHSASIP